MTTKIDITIPLNYNDGKPIEYIKFDKIERELLREFNGLTISGENKGFWLDDRTVYLDTNKIYSVVTDKIDVITWIKSYKKWLEHNLEQKEIFIVISEVSII